jgi:DNA-binding IclR family transcriptional regulator
MDLGEPVKALIPGVPGRVLTVLAGTGAELTMREVAELADVSANRAIVVLNRLVHLGLVARRDVGSAGLVRLMKDN